MKTKINVAARYWSEGVSSENICRLAGMTHQQLYRYITRHPSRFQRHGTHDNPELAYQTGCGLMPPKVSGTYGIPRSLILTGQCCFPLWGDDEYPDALSLMCGEPTQKNKQYCTYHYNLCCVAVAAERLLDGAEA